RGQSDARGKSTCERPRIVAGGVLMRRALVLALVSLSALALAPLVATAAPLRLPSSSSAPTAAGTVTATGSAFIPPPEDPVNVVSVQLQGQISQSVTFDAYDAKLQRIRRAVIAAGVPESNVTAAKSWAEPNGAGGIVNFNSAFRYEVKSGPVAVAAAQG